MSRCCSQCGSNGHNSLTCGESSSAASADAVGGGGTAEIMLFGFRVKVDPMRKSVSMNNLSQYEQTPNMNRNGTSNLKNSNDSEKEKAVDDADAGGYVSADDAVQHHSTGGRERKRGIPWTEEEHKLFLLGLQKVGKGDWRGISRNFVKTRTPTQVASHAQKYYLRKNNLNRRRRRSSLFDITTDSVPAMPLEDEKTSQDNSANVPKVLQLNSVASADSSHINGYAVTPYPMTVGPIMLPVQVQNPLENKTIHWVDQVQNGPTMLLRPVPVIPVAASPATTGLNLNQRVETEPPSLSLRLSLSSDHSQASTRHSGFGAMASFSNGDSIVSVA